MPIIKLQKGDIVCTNYKMDVIKNQFLRLIMTYIYIYLAKVHGFNHQPNKVLIVVISALEAVLVSCKTSKA